VDLFRSCCKPTHFHICTRLRPVCILSCRTEAASANIAVWETKLPSAMYKSKLPCAVVWWRVIYDFVFVASHKGVEF